MNYHDLPPANQLTAGGSVKDELRDDQRVCLGCRPTAIEAIGLRTLLFTGDSEVMANAVGVEIGVDGIQAELLPNDKVERFSPF